MVHIKDVMENELYEWDSFPLQLPSSSFADLSEEQRRSLFNLFQVGFHFFFFIILDSNER